MKTQLLDLDKAVEDGDLLQSSADNIRSLLDASKNPIDHAAVEQLAENGAWQELNDRFFRKLAFGTGGLRGRTIGNIVTPAERGSAGPEDRPEHPSVGTNAMNFYNLSRATQGLVAYVKQQFAGRAERPIIIFAHDTRHFATEFTDFCARVCTENGCDVFRFESARSTPELSFAVRHLGAQAGVMLTASHNPPHDNGYKVYFDDGCQITEPHASGIIGKVNAITSDTYEALPKNQQGTVTALGKEMDELFITRLKTVMLQPELLEKAKGLKIVYTNLHGTGGVIITQLLERLGFDYLTVPEQDTHDGRFPTIESPNPENASALKMALELGEKENADIVIGTDPDCDRMGVAVKNKEGQLTLLTGNQIGSLLAYYRTRTLFELGILNEENRENAVLVKTFVTTNLQQAIADHYGIRCVDTLTGFKYIGGKLSKYEAAIPADQCEDYRSLNEEESRALRLKHSSFFVFGGEESYGYLGSDFIRDKDGNGAVTMFCELAAYAKSRDLSLPELLDEVYQKFGYYQESNHAVLFEGAAGAAKIQKLAASYSENPPTEADGSAVTKVMNFNEDDFEDVEGDPIPKEKMIQIEMADGRRFNVRPSGTEPKIKYYLFGKAEPPQGREFTAEEVAAIKTPTDQSLASLWKWLEADIDQRLGS